MKAKTKFFKKNPTHSFSSMDDVSDYQAGRQALKDIRKAGLKPLVDPDAEFGLFKKLLRLLCP